MNRDFLELYQLELKQLYEKSRQFAEEYPGVARRLGGLIEDKMDPGIAGLLEGAAFMAARVQLKLNSEFFEFTSSLLDQILPDYLSPVPSAALIEAAPAFDDPNLKKGVRFDAGSYVDAVYVEQQRRVSCRFRLCSELTIWPLHLEAAQYFAAPTPLQALGLEILPGVAAGMRLSFRRRTSKLADDKPGVTPPGAPVSELQIESLPVALVGTEVDSVALYEQIFANCRRVTLRYLDAFGDPHFVATPPEMIAQMGFEEGASLLGENGRVFSGFSLLRDFFAFPARYTGFRLEKLRKLLARVDAPAFDLLFEFDASIPRLASVVQPRSFSLYAAAAANLFEMQCSRVPVRRNEAEHHVVADRSRWLDYEVHRVIDVFAHYSGRSDKVRVFPLYSLPTDNTPLRDALFYTTRKLPRRETVQEERIGMRSNYVGSETFLSLKEPAGIDDAERVRELSVRALASNRHLTEQLPVGEAGTDFFLADDTSIPLICLAGPTAPKESVVTAERRQRSGATPGTIAWKLINILSLNHLGLVDRSPQDRAAGLRELLGLFADFSDVVTERRIRGVVGVSSRAITRRLRQANGFNAARGVEITVRFDERAFEGNGIMLLGAVLDRFFAEYTSINSFTETVIESAQRGVVKRWPPRSGTGGVL
ncbi:MAG: type VI secretion system baseplate subunit TssF [Rhizobiaceae bacterium]|nr:type VI secretion system baseplate subunit TssF [Rhizobiaceae bacterium]